MSKSLPTRWLAALPALAALTVPAQVPPAPADTTAAAAPASALPYRSAFADYQPFADQKVGPWKEANDTVGKAGGWRAYAKEAAQPQPAAAPAPAGNPTLPHAGHGQH